MVKTLEPAKCVVVFSDDIYSDIFDANWFKRFRSAIPFITIHAEESDDLYAPSEEIQESLLLAKGKGCQMYIMLITNGLQAARLLEFGDRYRALDTLSKYILLYDHRLFEEKLFYLWKKIINVIFIRKYSSRTFKNNNKNDLSWFEITTVPFPVPITQVMIPRRLDIWTQSKFRKNEELFSAKTSDLQNQTLKVVLFAHMPGIIKMNTTHKTVRAILKKNSNNATFSGIEAEILQSVAKAMNFRYEVYEPENADTEMWGQKMVGGLYTGLIGEIVSTKADIALADLYYTSYILDVMDLSVPYNTECLTFITPESLNDNSWKTLILPFSPILWTTVLISLSLCIISFHYIARFHIKITAMKNQLAEQKSRLHPTKVPNIRKVLTLSLYPEVEKLDPNVKYTMMKEKYQVIRNEEDPVGLYQFGEPVNSALYTYSMILLVSLPKLPSGWSLRVLIGWYWIYCLLVVTSYRASMTAILAKPAPKVKIDTLEELVDSSLTLSGWGEINSEFFKSSPDLTMQQIAQNFVLVNDSEKAVDRVAEDSYAFYENIHFLKESLVKRQQRFQKQLVENKSNHSEKTGKKEDRMLHIMNECIINMPVSIGLQRNSPLKPRVDKYMRRVIEAGLIHKWLDDVMQNILNAEVQTEVSGNSKALMNMRKFAGALVALFIGYIISIIALLAEIIYFKRVIVNNDNFNKYSRRVELPILS
ncbi:unnamed protein product, partial [Phaedon cochleariae]